MLRVVRQLAVKPHTQRPLNFAPVRRFYSPEKQSKEELRAEDEEMERRRQMMKKQVLERMQYKGKESTGAVLFRRSLIGLGIAMTAHFLFHQYAVSRGVFDKPGDENTVSERMISRNVSAAAQEVMQQNTDMVKDLLERQEDSNNNKSADTNVNPQPKVFKGNPYLLMQQQAEEDKRKAEAALK